MQEKSTPNYLLITVILLLGIGIGYLFKTLIQQNGESYTQEKRLSGYEYINPLIDSEFIEETKRSDLLEMESKLQSIVSTSISYESAQSISIYYKDLLSGAWIGINEKEKYTPASLLKVSVMITYYKLAEQDPTLLSKEVVVKHKNNDLDPNIKPELALELNKVYTIDELIDRMIMYSDNDALLALYEELDPKESTIIFNDLGLELPEDTYPENFISPKDYASFFRILYNASYLTRDMSSKALELLTKTAFTKGLRQGVPEDIKLAHKFGERGYSNSDAKQMHDCGIVYHPEQPYLLCIMTRGNDFSQLEYIIQTISKEVYKDINK